LESNKIQLRGCTKNEAKELVSRRVEQFFVNDDAETIIKWLLSQLESKLIRAFHSPREVILLANQIIRDASGEPIPKPSESMTAEYEWACDSVMADFDTWDPESEYLKVAAELFLKHQENVLSCEPGDNRYITWTGTLKTSGSEVPYACFINTAWNWRTVAATLERCKTFLQKNPDGVCTYITDARYDFKLSWTATNKQRQEIEALGGNIVILDQSSAKRWYGLVSLSWKIGSGDITLEGESGSRPATDKDLAMFLKTGFSEHAIEGLFDRLTQRKAALPVKPTQVLPSSHELIQAMKDCLLANPLRVMKIERLLEKLHEKGIHVTQEYCLEQIGKNQNVFSLIPVMDGFMVKLTAEKIKN
jgi:hypothetical protein